MSARERLGDEFCGFGSNTTSKPAPEPPKPKPKK